MAKIAILGDIKLNDQHLQVDKAFKSLLKEMDLVIANLEGPIIENALPRADKKGEPLSSDQSIRSAIEELSIDLLTFGNNHILDFGLKGLYESIDFVESLDVSWTGACDDSGRGSFLYLNDKLGLAVFSFAHREGPFAEIDVSGLYGPYALPEPIVLKDKIRQLVKEKYNVLISYHGGEELFDAPWPRRLAWSKSLVDAGAMLVFSHHSHSVQPVFSVASGFLAPGLGNTFFCTEGQKRNLGTENGLCLILDTEAQTLNYVSIKADWYNSKLFLSDKLYRDPIKYCEHDLIKRWTKDCRKFLFGGGLKLKPQPFDWWKNPARSVLFVRRVMVQKFKSIRDTDILLGSLPIIGLSITKNSVKSAPETFRF